MSATDEYEFFLPESAIAQEPPARRGDSRALFLVRGRDGGRFGRFSELPELLRGDECLVVNDTRVIPARVRARRASGGAVEAFLLSPEEDGTWRAWLTPSRRLKPGELLETEGAPLRVLEKEGRWWRVSLPEGELERIGQVPLPPYIRREPGDPRLRALDAERYQTVFASRAGAVAAPTAGLHFTPELLGELEDRGVPVVPVTLHVGPGTFAPIRADRLEDHRVDPEWFEISGDSRRRLARAREEGRRIICVGTTSMRVIESVPDLDDGPALTGECALTILPGHRFRHAEGLITNFHLPRSSLLVLVSAFHGRERTLAGYRDAVEAGLKFYSYGDAMVILPDREAAPDGAS
ncbi:MAG: tRNA preQ1(34) S-adenosylmethionine ribosyltransferase-isomerase QueA [Planctomycetota bacterium]|jgi:S-adenosylmethionine:tRNA ribosyltransferase-isomerase